MTTERPLTDKEFIAIKKNIRQLDKNRHFQIKFLIGWTIFSIILGILVYISEKKISINFLILIATIYVGIGIWVYLETYFKQKEERKSIEFVLKNNKVKSVNVVSTDYYQLSEVEDEGVFYLFQLPENKILSFGGQDFRPTKKFPSHNFEIAICYGIKNEIVLLEIYNYGNKLQPKLKITGQKKWDLIGHPNFPNPDKFTIIDGQLENFETFVLGREI